MSMKLAGWIFGVGVGFFGIVVLLIVIGGQISEDISSSIGTFTARYWAYSDSDNDFHVCGVRLRAHMSVETAKRLDEAQQAVEGYIGSKTDVAIQAQDGSWIDLGLTGARVLAYNDVPVEQIEDVQFKYLLDIEVARRHTDGRYGSGGWDQVQESLPSVDHPLLKLVTQPRTYTHARLQFRSDPKLHAVIQIDPTIPDHHSERLQACVTRASLGITDPLPR